jgi:hypothetical protein
MRTPAALAATALVASTLVTGVLGGQTAANAEQRGLSRCSVANPTDVPCISSASRNGTDPMFGPTSEYSVTGSFRTPDAGADDQSTYLNIVILRNDDQELGADSLDDDFSVTVNLSGQLVPRVATGKARNVTVTRTDNGDGTYAVTIEGRPVRLDGQCDQEVYPWVCPEDGEGTAEQSQEWKAIWSADVTDYGSWSDATQRNSMYGMNYFNNIAATDVPPQVRFDDAGLGHLLIEMNNRHFREDGKTPVQGRAELRIPNAFLEEVYGIPDPATMDGSSLVATGSATGPGTVTIAQESGKDAMRVVVGGITFSMKELLVETGTITPREPKNVDAERLRRHKGQVSFTKASARGAEVTGYRVRCRSVVGQDVVTSDRIATATGKEFFAVMEHLRAATAYTCRVRATSEAGPGSWSDVARMSAKR